MSRVLDIAAGSVLVVELLIFAVLVAFTPIQVGVEIDRRLFALPVEVAEPIGDLLTIWVAVSLLAGAATSFGGRLSARSGVRAFQGLVLLTCALVQIYVGPWLLRSVLAATDHSEQVTLGCLLAGAVGVIVGCSALWLRENRGWAHWSGAARRSPGRHPASDGRYRYLHAVQLQLVGVEGWNTRQEAHHQAAPCRAPQRL